MPKYVRVRDKETGHHLTIPRARLEREGDVWQVLKQSATDASGEPLPPKFHTSVSSETTKKASQSAASDNKEK